jgi:hypothetical protein
VLVSQLTSWRQVAQGFFPLLRVPQALNGISTVMCGSTITVAWYR